jgi:exonuclease III
MEPALTDLIKSFRGQVVGARLRLANNSGLVAVSVHSPARTVSRTLVPQGIIPEIKLKQNRWIWRADVIYGALRHLPRITNKFVVGGDWNTSRLFDERYGPRGNEEFFQRMSDAGLMDCRQGFFPVEQRTWFRPGNAHYQLDHVFCDPASGKNIRKYRVDPTPAESGLSDHATVVVEFN